MLEEEDGAVSQCKWMLLQTDLRIRDLVAAHGSMYTLKRAHPVIAASQTGNRVHLGGVKGIGEEHALLGPHLHNCGHSLQALMAWDPTALRPSPASAIGVLARLFLSGCKMNFHKLSEWGMYTRLLEMYEKPGKEQMNKLAILSDGKIYLFMNPAEELHYQQFMIVDVESQHMAHPHQLHPLGDPPACPKDAYLVTFQHLIHLVFKASVAMVQSGDTKGKSTQACSQRRAP